MAITKGGRAATLKNGRTRLKRTKTDQVKTTIYANKSTNKITINVNVC